MTIVTGMLALASARWATPANLAATVFYLGATLLVYLLLRPVSRNLSLLAALFSLAGCAVGTVETLGLASAPVNSLVFFGLHCLLVGTLIVRSGFLPRILGVLLGLGGLGWLSFIHPPLASFLFPWIILPGLVGEGALSLWLLAFGVNVAESQSPSSSPMG